MQPFVHYCHVTLSPTTLPRPADTHKPRFADLAATEAPFPFPLRHFHQWGMACGHWLSPGSSLVSRCLAIELAKTAPWCESSGPHKTEERGQAAPLSTSSSMAHSLCWCFRGILQIAFLDHIKAHRIWAAPSRIISGSRSHSRWRYSIKGCSPAERIQWTACGWRSGDYGQ